MANARDARRTAGRKTHKAPAEDLPTVFAGVYGSRWSKLYHALAHPTEHVALRNAFASGADLAEAGWKADFAVGPIEVCSYVPHEETYPQPTPDPHTRLLSWYWLDRASLLPPLLLDPLPGHTVLDMCSAPGGKSLMLAYSLFAQKGSSPTTRTATASHTTQTQPGQTCATSDVTANNTPAMNCSASSSLPQPALASNTTMPQHDDVSSQNHVAALSAPHEHEQAQTSTQHFPQSLTHSTANAISDLAEHGTPAEPEGCLAEAASMPATLSAQHGQNVALCGSLTCNEMDAPRRSRLQSVLNAYLPLPLKRKVSMLDTSIAGECVDVRYSTVCRVTPHDAARYWNRFEAEAYDCILLDAPCTSERHVVLASCGGRGSKPRWSLHQCKEMAALQVKLLTAALKAVKPGGRVVYSTCSISPMENDGVVSKALASMQGQLQVSIGNVNQYLDQRQAPSAGTPVLDSLPGLLQQLGAEATEHGVIILPDQTGAGPMYVCLLMKEPCSVSHYSKVDLFKSYTVADVLS